MAVYGLYMALLIKTIGNYFNDRVLKTIVNHFFKLRLSLCRTNTPYKYLELVLRARYANRNSRDLLYIRQLVAK